MSKFIRTENMIYKLTDNLIIKDNQLYEKEYGSDYFSLELIYLRDAFLGKVIKQADTIDELCDGFYIDNGQEEFCLDDVFTNFDKFKSVCEYNTRYCAGKYEGYGFIKTPKGLVYVAKMNNKEGDLELIWVNN